MVGFFVSDGEHVAGAGAGFVEAVVAFARFACFGDCELWVYCSSCVCFWLAGAVIGALGVVRLGESFDSVELVLRGWALLMGKSAF